MNKEIKIDRNIKILFIVDILVFVMTLILRYTYINIGYYYKLVNIAFILNILFFILCIIYTIYLVLGKKVLDHFILIIFSLLGVYILFNTLGVIFINKPIEKQYKKTAEKVLSYCEQYSCDTYETKYMKDKRILTIQKTYFDYDNNENTIVFETLYDKDKIINLTASIDSSSDLYSEEIIKKELDSYFLIFDKQINEKYVINAFENRFIGEIKHNDMTYKVTEIYDNNNLIKLKTIITLKLNDWKKLIFLIYYKYDRVIGNDAFIHCFWSDYSCVNTINS